MRCSIITMGSGPRLPRRGNPQAAYLQCIGNAANSANLLGPGSDAVTTTRGGKNKAFKIGVNTKTSREDGELLQLPRVSSPYS